MIDWQLPSTLNCLQPPMNVKIDINQSIKEQFEHFFKLDEQSYLDPTIGVGGPVKYLIFPGELEFYHFGSARFAIPIVMKSINPPDSEWFLIHINLSASKQRKSFSGKSIEFHKDLPIGMLVYGPGLEIDTEIPPDIDAEFASIRFSVAFLDSYFENWRKTLSLNKNLILEDLDFQLESNINKALSSMEDKIHCHASVLAFLSRVFDKLDAHEKPINYENLRPSDIQGLFRACTTLRSPLDAQVPKLSELATLANMGRTKFKSAFKQVFGSAPMQYRNRVRLEYARDQISYYGKTPTEISYLLGYSHPSNFTAAYKKQFGNVPSAHH